MKTKYNFRQLIERFDSGERLKFLFFWGHTEKGEKVTKACFSQWYPSVFEVEKTTYQTAEHWMMAQKALLFGDRETFEKIIRSSNPGEAKKLGRQVKNFDPLIWDKHKYEIVVQGNIYKFSQNPKLSDFLLNTKNRILVEASPVDPVWGIGKAADQNNVDNPHTWRGENLLGFALMEVRDQLSL